MEKETKKGMSRRRFLGTSAAGIAGMTMFSSLPACRRKTDDKILTLGFIGVGRQAMYLLDGFIKIPDVKVVACSDVYGIKRQRFENRVNDYYREAEKDVEVASYEKYQELLKREDIDAVVIATPDHAHAMIAIAACKAGKDVYLEKPLTFTIKEGQELVKAVRENNRILAVGSQQRSDPNFQHAVKMVQDGALGRIKKIHAYVGAPPTPYDLPEETVPSDLNWDLWLASLPGDIHYNHKLNPPISLDPPEDEKIWGAWRWYKEMGGGFTTDWGAHMFDIAQWALKKDNSGPVEISPIGDGTEYMQFVYDNGVVMTSEPFDEDYTKGVKFIGENGWIEISRNIYRASDDGLLPPDNGKNPDDGGAYETAIPHLADFIEATRERRDPVVPVETGHRTCTVCTLGNIACDLKRTIKWDPEAERFIDDENGEATRQLHYQYRDGWSLT